MDRHPEVPTTARDGFLAIMLLIIVGFPAFVFLNILTAGLFMYLFLALGVMALLGSVHYFLWGRSFNSQLDGEREELELRQSALGDCEHVDTLDN